jgi:hypothetical protein
MKEKTPRVDQAELLSDPRLLVRSGFDSRRRATSSGGGGNRSRQGRSRFHSGLEAHPPFPSENGAPICPGESMRVRSIWSPWAPCRARAASPLASNPSSGADTQTYYHQPLRLLPARSACWAPGGPHRAQGARCGCHRAMATPHHSEPHMPGPGHWRRCCPPHWPGVVATLVTSSTAFRLL